MTIPTKSRMYRLLQNGVLGNTVPQWTNRNEWFNWCVKNASKVYSWWGVRTLTPGGPCRLNCPADEVPSTCYRFEEDGHGINISPMVDRITNVTLWANIWDSPSGLIVEGIEYPPKCGSWRELMPDPSKFRQWKGVAARLLLSKHLNANSKDDLDILLDRYAGHVVELSALETCFGTIPGRNTILWEVRQY